MSEEAFLRAVTEQPDDDGPRLVYADWLEERGDADRAAFIRAQCELARLAPDDPRADKLALAAQDLLAAHRDDWGPFQTILDDQQFRRGFLEAAEVRHTNAAEFLRRAGEVFARTPLRELRFVADRGLGVPLEDLLACPHLARLERLAFHEQFQLPDDNWEAASQPACADGAVRQVVSCPRLAGLRGLAFVDHVAMTPYGFGFLALAAPLGLRALDLSVHDIGMTDEDRGRDEGVVRLAAAPRLAGLTALALHNNGLTNAALRALARSSHLTRLERLDLSDNEAVGDAGVRALAGSSNLAAVRSLNLEGARITAAGVAALAGSEYARGLRELNLAFTHLDGVGARTLAAAPWEGLARLTLGGPSFDDAGLDALGSAALPALHKLELISPPITPDGLRRLADAPLLERLTDLGLTVMSAYPADAVPLAASPRLGRLRALALKLPLARCGKLLAELCHNPALAGLHHLELGLPGLTPDDLRLFAASPLPARLTALALEPRDEIEEAEFLRALTAADLRRLRLLDLGDLALTDAGAEVLAAAPRLPELRVLRFGRRALSYAAEQHLQARFGPRFQILVVERR